VTEELVVSNPGRWLTFHMADMPSGTVTFLFTDLEGSTRLWEEHPTAMEAALARHDELVRNAIESHNGHVVKFTGDGFHAAFATAHDALGAALAAQQGLVRADWDDTGPLRARMGVHSGEAQHRDGDYHGTALNRAARLMGVAHGGQIVVSAVTQALVADTLPDGVQLHDLGEHRLRDLAQPLRIFEVRHPELAGPFPPLRSLDIYASNLPVQLSSFIGRDDEVAAIAEALAEHRLVTLTGVGGVGKTRTAIQAAAHLLPDFGDGVWLCELAAAADSDSMAQVVAVSVGASAKDAMTLMESTVDVLRGRSVLLVLDNCEHLLGPAGEFAERVLRSCPRVRVLATSREGLAVEGERVLPLGSLDVPPAGADYAAIMASGAVRLFAGRALAVDPGFVLDAASAPTVGEICRRLDGIPLAIELAAPRVTTMTPGEIASHLDERFRLLTGGRRTAVERHHTLRATVDWSYSLLDSSERAVFDRLGVFPGDFDSDAAVAVAATDGIEPWSVIDGLTTLVAKHMVVAARDGDTTTRFALLETLRQYARERLDEDGNADASRRRHADHYATFAEIAGRELTGPDELASRARVSEEVDNLRAAVLWSVESTDNGELGMRIVAALANESWLHRQLGLGSWADRARIHVHRTTPARRTAILAAAAFHQLSMGDPVTARALAVDALEGGLPADVTSAMLPFLTLAIADLQAGRPERATTVITEARRALAAIDAGPVEDGMLQALAHFIAMVAGLPISRSDVESSLAFARRAGNPTLLVQSIMLRAWFDWHERPEAALAECEEALTLTRAGAPDTMFAMALGLSAQIRAMAGDPGALAVLRESIVRADDLSRAQLVTIADRAIRTLERLDHFEAAAVLGGAVTAGPFAPLSSVAKSELPDRLAAIDRARAILGPERYEHAYARGSAMTYDELMQYALASVDELIAERGDG